MKAKAHPSFIVQVLTFAVITFHVAEEDPEPAENSRKYSLPEDEG